MGWGGGIWYNQHRNNHVGGGGGGELYGISYRQRSLEGGYMVNQLVGGGGGGGTIWQTNWQRSPPDENPPDNYSHI